MEAFKVLLVDDHALVRAGIKGLVDQLQDFKVVAEAADRTGAMQQALAAAPDIVVTDLTLGSESGLDVVRDIRAALPQARVMILSMHASEELVAEGLRLGASAYLLKEAAPGELEIALRAVVRGETYLSPVVSTKMIKRFVSPPAQPANPLEQLTARQIQVLTLFAQGKGTKEIAYELDLSEKTVAAHRAQIMERVGVRDLVGLVLFAVKSGLVKAQE